MKQAYLFIFALGLLSLTSFSSCEKEDAPDNVIKQNEQKATQFKAKVLTKGFVVTEFYADKDIDYITTDTEVRAEKDLNKYIYEYLKDDRIVLQSDGKLQIHQNAIKKSGLDSAVLNRNWNIFSNRAGVFFDFVDDTYTDRRYKLEEFHEDHFIVYLDWPANEAKIYSKFEFQD